MWVGVTYGKNSLGVLCMLSALFLIWMLAKTRKQTKRSSARYETMANVVVLGLTFWLLRGRGGAYSATSVVVLIIGLATLFTLRRRNLSLHLLAMACLFTLTLGLFYPFIWQSLTTNPVRVVASWTGRSETLTGRNQIWNQLIPVSQEHPVLGVGYGGFWINPLEFDKFTVNQAHNGYLDIFIEVGAVGLILFTILVVSFFQKVTEEYKLDIEWGSFRLTFLLVSLLHNLTESSYLKSTALIWNIFILLLVINPIRTVPEKGVLECPHDT
jgi:O-antigen ligase